MGLFSFAKNAGAAVFKSGDEKKADSIKEYVLEQFDKQAVGNTIENFTVEYDEGTVCLSGVCNTRKTMEKAILIAGNIEDVENVDADKLQVAQAPPQSKAPAAEPAASPAPQTEGEGQGRASEPSPAPAQAAPPEPESQFYTIQSGDTLSKIANEFYGDANKYMFIFEENTGVIDDPDKIYPGQVIRIPPAE